jgi:UDP-N-acetylmuramate--alanine ligase
MVICLGAGNITNWAYALPGELDALASDGHNPARTGSAS